MMPTMSVFFWMLVSIASGIVIGASLQRSAVIDLIEDLSDLHFQLYSFYPNIWLGFLKTKITYSGLLVQELSAEDAVKIRRAVQMQAPGSFFAPPTAYHGPENESAFTPEREAL